MRCILNHMQRKVRKLTYVRKLVNALKKVFRLFGTILIFFRNSLQDDIIQIWIHARLFFGTAFISIGLLSFSPNRYCDGNASNYYACTRPSTYYTYPWWAIGLVIIGSFLIILWYLRRKTR